MDEREDGEDAEDADRYLQGMARLQVVSISGEAGKGITLAGETKRDADFVGQS